MQQILCYLCSRVVKGTNCKAIVIPAIGEEVGLEIRKNDLSWKNFLLRIAHKPR